MSKEQIIIDALKEMKHQYEIVHTSAMRHHHELTRIKERGGDYSEKDLQEHSILKTVWGTIINQLNNLISQYTQSQQEPIPSPESDAVELLKRIAKDYALNDGLFYHNDDEDGDGPLLPEQLYSQLKSQKQ